MGEPWDTLLRVFGPVGFLLAVALITVVRGDWIPRKSHNETINLMKVHHMEIVEGLKEENKRCEQRAAEWQGVALRSLDVGEQATLVGKVLVTGTKP
jgi:hypothetical protein